MITLAKRWRWVDSRVWLDQTRLVRSLVAFSVFLALVSAIPAHAVEPEAAIGRAWVLARQGDHKLALDVLYDAEHSTNDARLLSKVERDRAVIYFDLGQPQKAMASFLKARQLNASVRLRRAAHDQQLVQIFSCTKLMLDREKDQTKLDALVRAQRFSGDWICPYNATAQRPPSLPKAQGSAPTYVAPTGTGQLIAFWTSAAVAAGGLALGIAFGISSLNAAKALETKSLGELDEGDRQLRQRTKIANIGYGVAGAGAVSALVFGLWYQSIPRPYSYASLGADLSTGQVFVSGRF